MTQFTELEHSRPMTRFAEITPADEKRKITDHAGLLELMNLDLHYLITREGDQKTIELIDLLISKNCRTSEQVAETMANFS